MVKSSPYFIFLNPISAGFVPPLAAISQILTEPSVPLVHIIFGICGLKITFEQAFLCPYNTKTGSCILRLSYPNTCPLSVERAKLCSRVGCQATDSISFALLGIKVFKPLLTSLTSTTFTRES